MAQPKRSDHHLPPKPLNGDAEIIPFRDVVSERPREPEVPVEAYLLSDDGKADMEELFATLDHSGNIIRTLAFKITETRRHLEKDDDPTIYALINHDDGGQGLTRLELIDLYDTNPLIQATLAAVHRKHNKGDYQAKHLYTFGLRVFMNMVRYEWLTRTHDAHDPVWQDRAARLGDYDSGVYKVHLQPGHNRPDTVGRNSPSDYLERPITE